MDSCKILLRTCKVSEASVVSTYRITTDIAAVIPSKLRFPSNLNVGLTVFLGMRDTEELIMLYYIGFIQRPHHKYFVMSKYLINKFVKHMRN